MIKSSFLKDKEQGYQRCSKLALENVKGLYEIIKWNNEHRIEVFRMTSCLFPWMSEYELHQLPDYEEIAEILAAAGKIAIENNQRLSFHPGHFNILASPNESVVKGTIKELNQHSQIMDLMGLPANHMSEINIHVGGHYGNKSLATKRWIENFKLLDPNTQSRLVVENDDKAGLYSVKDLYNYIYKEIGIPITFDFLHHDCHPDNTTEQEALEMALSTWPSKVIPSTHYSSSRKLHEDESAKKLAHADYVYEEIKTYGHTFDITLEAKAKDLAVLKYRKDYHSAEFKTN
jgi:UV DNA damage endonuclease